MAEINENDIFKYHDDLKLQMEKFNHSWTSEKFPVYNHKANYNTNSPSYYDFLARAWSYMLYQVEQTLNRLLKRNLLIKDTSTVYLVKEGDWLSNECGIYNDEITISANVRISKQLESIVFKKFQQKEFILKNAIKVYEDGIYSRDYTDVINQIDSEIGRINQEINDINNAIDTINNNIKNLQNQIDNINKVINNLTGKYDGILQKIINSLFNSGGITNNDINNFEFVSGVNIATGNISLFGGNADGSSYIKTSKNKNENDLAGGL